nr:immunoglobulin heavy chain junction region [Macaca mulatta]MOW33398.1 immunoglobulin heavy chain junction region [Macaca mulatta]
CARHDYGASFNPFDSW